MSTKYSVFINCLINGFIQFTPIKTQLKNIYLQMIYMSQVFFSPVG